MLTDQIEDSLRALRRAIAVRRELGDVRAEGDALQRLSDVLWCPGRVAEARDAAKEAVAVLEDLPPGRELAMAYCRLAQLCMDAEDVAETVTWGTRALELAETLGETCLGRAAAAGVRARVGVARDGPAVHDRARV
jgi:tetratricopeptide (TPR) repeat protein